MLLFIKANGNNEGGGGGEGVGGAKSGTLRQTDQRFEKIKETNLVVGVVSSQADA